MEGNMNTWQSLGFQGNCHTLPDQFSSNSTIKSNEIVSFPPLISCHGIGSRQNFRNIVASDSLLSWDDIFQNCRWLALEPMMTSGWCSLMNLSIVLLYDSMFSLTWLHVFLKWLPFFSHMTPCFSHMTPCFSHMTQCFSLTWLNVFITWLILFLF